MLVRQATPEDAAAFAAVVAEVAEENRWIATEPPVDADAFAARICAMLADGSTFLVLDDGRRIVGTLGLHPTHADGVVALRRDHYRRKDGSLRSAQLMALPL